MDLSNIPTTQDGCALGGTLGPFCGPLNWCLDAGHSLAANLTVKTPPEDLACPEMYIIGTQCFNKDAVCAKINGECNWKNEGVFKMCLEDAQAEVPKQPVDPATEPFEEKGCIISQTMTCGPKQSCGNMGSPASSVSISDSEFCRNENYDFRAGIISWNKCMTDQKVACIKKGDTCAWNVTSASDECYFNFTTLAMKSDAPRHGVSSTFFTVMSLMALIALI